MSAFKTMGGWVEINNDGSPIDPALEDNQWQGPNGIVHSMDIDASQLVTLCGIHTTEAYFDRPSKAWTFTTRAPTCLTCLAAK